ncbi:MAG: hypothetical protein ABSC94_19520 [Polyangiaceae bacterium]
MERLRAPPLLLFGVLSLALHLLAFGSLKGAAAEGPAFDPVSETFSGDTLDLEALRDGPGPLSSGDEPVIQTAPTSPRGGGPSARTRGNAPSAPGAVVPSGAPRLFGAVGVPYAADLATTFTRAFPQAASADPLWQTAPFGSAGTAQVTLLIDGDGRLTSSAIAGTPSAALRAGIERTVALLGSRPFKAEARITRLRVVARVARDDLHDGLHGDVFALSGGSFTGDVGSAFFALPTANGPGRRIDVDFRTLP